MKLTVGKLKSLIKESIGGADNLEIGDSVEVNKQGRVQVFELVPNNSGAPKFLGIDKKGKKNTFFFTDIVPGSKIKFYFSQQ